ncbi:hypothetical protein OsJ_26507 [Oryza sativa Japonica Group]|uniref:Uncharacterized protein n=1 Tax=Oryza sativa subsp. japonica TaxID=39947 RepID=B9FZQ6_ORYSJ|nr:hypothetical protein OsJ_26507 [Oryza sativa Japonica Group]
MDSVRAKARRADPTLALEAGAYPVPGLHGGSAARAPSIWLELKPHAVRPQPSPMPRRTTHRHDQDPPGASADGCSPPDVGQQRHRRRCAEHVMNAVGKFAVMCRKEGIKQLGVVLHMQPKPVHQPECNNVASVDTGMSNPAARADSSHCIPGRKAMSSISLSFSGLTGESSAGDFKIVGYCQ